MHVHDEPMSVPVLPRGVFARRPAWVKFLVMVVVVVGAALCPRGHGWLLAGPGGVVVLLALFAGVEPWVLVKRILALEPFVVGVALLALFSPGTAGERWAFFGFLMAR